MTPRRAIGILLVAIASICSWAVLAQGVPAPPSDPLVDRILHVQRAQIDHRRAGMGIADLVQNLGRKHVCLSADVGRLLFGSPVEQAAVESVAGGAGRLE